MSHPLQETQRVGHPRFAGIKPAPPANNPLRFIDPTGKFMCMPTGGDKAVQKKCLEFAKTVDGALKSKDPNVVRAAKAYGKMGDSNGVYVTFVDKLKGDRGGTVTRHDMGIEADPHSPNGFRATVDVKIKSDQASNEETMVHEGSHVADRQDFVNAIGKDGSMENAKALNITLRQSEIKAYQLSIALALKGNKTLNFGPCGSMDECKFTPGMMPAQKDQRINELLDDPRNHYENLNNVLFPEWPHQ